MNKKTIKVGLAYEICGLPNSKAIQKVYVGTTYLYALQMKTSTTVTISRCKLDIANHKATYVDHMTVLNCGHNQTFTYYKWKEKPFFWLTCIPSPQTATRVWAIECGRLQYQPHKTINATSLTRMCDIQYIYGTSKNVLGKVERLESAVGVGKKRLFLWVKGTNKRAFVVCDFDKINSMLDKHKNKATSCKSNSDYAKSIVVQPRFFSGLGKYMPRNSLQGLDFNGSTLLTIGGEQGGTPSLYKIVCPSFSAPSTLYMLSHKDFNNRTNGTEVESVQRKKDGYTYFGVSDKSKPLGNGRARVYRFKTSLLV